MNQVAEQYEEKIKALGNENSKWHHFYGFCSVSQLLRTSSIFSLGPCNTSFRMQTTYFLILCQNSFRNSIKTLPPPFQKHQYKPTKKIYNRKLSRNAINVLITLTTHLLQFKIHKKNETDCMIRTLHLPQFIYYDHKLHCPP